MRWPANRRAVPADGSRRHPDGGVQSCGRQALRRPRAGPATHVARRRQQRVRRPEIQVNMSLRTPPASAPPIEGFALERQRRWPHSSSFGIDISTERAGDEVEHREVFEGRRITVWAWSARGSAPPGWAFSIEDGPMIEGGVEGAMPILELLFEARARARRAVQIMGGWQESPPPAAAALSDKDVDSHRSG